MSEKVYVIIRKLRRPEEHESYASKYLEPDAYDDEEEAVARAKFCHENILRKLETGILATKIYDITFEINELTLHRKEK